MAKEKYQPTPEEIRKAEESMYPGQSGLTREKEKSWKALEAMGKFGYLFIDEIEAKGSDSNRKLHGKISGHDVSIHYHCSRGPTDKPFNNGFRGTIDGKALTARDAERIFEKYHCTAITNEEQSIRSAQDERERIEEEYQREEDLADTLRELLE